MCHVFLDILRKLSKMIMENFNIDLGDTFVLVTILP